MASKRKSWLPFASKTKDKTKGKGTQTSSNAEAPPSAFKDPELNDPERLRPIQFSPNRLQTLYVTPSERNLYLAAMSQLDENPPHLALWSDPAPSLPHIDHTPPISSPHENGMDWPQQPASVRGQAGSIIYNHDQNPKLVTSPEARTNGGLMVREEFRRLAPTKQAQHATMALTGGGGMRFIRFPANVLMELEKLFPPNKVVTETAEGLAGLGHGVVPFWKVKMFGSMWKRSGAEELDPIRLLVQILSCLGTHGWSVVNSIRAGGRKNLLFSHSAETAASPPAYFAISFPVSDRISLIFPPPKATPALLSAIRNAITSTFTSQNHSRSGTGSSADTQGAGTKSPRARVSWNDKKAKIKLEGWVQDGVYRFWLDGMRRKIVGGVKKDAVESLQPHVVINIVSALSSLHYSLSSSIPLQPTSAGRDILLFASQPDTGVAAQDAFKPKPQITGATSPRTDRSESLVMVHRTSSFPQAADDLNLVNPRAVDPERRVLPWTSTVARKTPDRSSPEHPRGVTPVSIRPPTLPPNQGHRRGTSIDSSQPLLPQASSVQSSPRPRNVLLKKTSIRRKTSNSSKHQSLPARSRQVSEVGLGENIRREHEGRTTRDTSDPGSWFMVDQPARVGHLGLTTYTGPQSQDPHAQAADHGPNVIPEPPITVHPTESQRQVSDGHTSSGQSGYETAEALLNPTAPRSPPRLPPRPQGQHQQPQSPPRDLPLPLPLGQPIGREDASQVSSSPAYLPLQSPRSPNRVNQPERVDIGIPSVHGSLGYIPSMMSQAPSAISHDPMPTQMPVSTTRSPNRVNQPEHVDLGIASVHGSLGYIPSMMSQAPSVISHDPMPVQRNGEHFARDEGTQGTLPLTPGGKPMEDRKGKGKEGARRIWDDERGVWVEGITPPENANGNESIGPGSARTRISMS